MYKKYHSIMVNANSIIKKAYENKYAIGHFNINNLEWTKSLLEAAQETNTPIILGVSENANKYMGGLNVVVSMVNSLLVSLNINIPIVLHLDHGQSIKICKDAIDAGFSSVMYDGSNYSFEENYKNTKEVLEYANNFGVSVEAEIGIVGGEEDGIYGVGRLGDPYEAKKMFDLGINFLAYSMGNFHGKYPQNWKGLNFEALNKIKSLVKIGLVLHGGSGIPKKQIKKAISYGVSKINVNTELQIAFAKATKKYIEIESKKYKNDKWFDPRNLLFPGTNAIKKTFYYLTKLFGCNGKGK